MYLTTKSVASTPNRPVPPPDLAIYLHYGIQEEGPFWKGEIISALHAQRIPADALYSRPGMATARPLAELVEELEAAAPRAQHHTFAYIALPDVIFSEAKFRSLCRFGNVQQEILSFWKYVGTMTKKSRYAVDSTEGLSAKFLPFTHDADLLLVTLPKPIKAMEAYFIGIVFPGSDQEATPAGLRYFILAYSPANQNFASVSGCVREIIPDVADRRVRDFVEPRPDRFLEVIHELCGGPEAITTVAEAQAEALRRFPRIAVSGTSFNTDFTERCLRYQLERPDYFKDIRWPITLADETARAVRGGWPQFG
jgi:hypothetical protein